MSFRDNDCYHFTLPHKVRYFVVFTCSIKHLCVYDCTYHWGILSQGLKYLGKVIVTFSRFHSNIIYRISFVRPWFCMIKLKLMILSYSPNIMTTSKMTFELWFRTFPVYYFLLATCHTTLHTTHGNQRCHMQVRLCMWVNCSIYTNGSYVIGINFYSLLRIKRESGLPKIALNLQEFRYIHWLKYVKQYLGL